jgi:hypothetical protein
MDVLFLGIGFMMVYGFGRTEHRGDRSRINQPLGLGYDRNESSHNSQLHPNVSLAYDVK